MDSSVNGNEIVCEKASNKSFLAIGIFIILSFNGHSCYYVYANLEYVAILFRAEINPKTEFYFITYTANVESTENIVH